MIPIHDAVTAALIHEGEVLVVRRQPHLLAFPGYHAFPGGKVDRTDGDEPVAVAELSALAPRIARALIRELREELDVDLDALSERGQLGTVRSLGIAVTPPFAPIRFATHYFSIEVGEKPPLKVDAGELAEAQWEEPARLVERFERGEMLAVPPTVSTLRTLAADPHATFVPGFIYDLDPELEIPRVETVKGLLQITVRSNTLPPADRTNCFLIGDARRVLVDPSPNSREELTRLYRLLDREGFDEIFLTHHHPDHREYADEVARRYGKPIGMSADTAARLGAMLKGLDVRIYREGDEVLRWLGQPVRAIEVPGHDEGQLALMPDNRAWCLVSDLFQGVGTVVIGGPEGNMRKYFDSLRKIIALNPRVIFPAHGMGVGTVWRLQETLRHREQREAQVKALVLAGNSEDEMLKAIYREVDPRLLPFARMNIRSHLQKLREENAVPA